MVFKQITGPTAKLLLVLVKHLLPCSEAEFNHKQDLHVEKIVKMKGKGQTKGEKTSQVLGNYFRLPYLLNLNNSFLSPRGRKHVLFTRRG